MKVCIYSPSRTAMQSGRAATGGWVLEYDAVTARAPESLMGWTASGDTLNQVRLRFDTQEQAAAFAQAKGWDFTILPPRDRRISPRNYSDNFRYRPPQD